MKYVKRAFLLVYSAGWIFPLWMGLDSFIASQEIASRGGANSFPVYGASRTFIGIAMGWLTFAVCSWVSFAIVLMERQNRTCADNTPEKA